MAVSTRVWPAIPAGCKPVRVVPARPGAGGRLEEQHGLWDDLPTLWLAAAPVGKGPIRDRRRTCRIDAATPRALPDTRRKLLTASTQWPVANGEPDGWNRLERSLRDPIADCLRQSGIPEDRFDHLRAVALRLSTWVHGQKGVGPCVIGIGGAQGSGKSTLSRLVGLILARGFGYRTAGLSLDDWYLTRTERQRLARTVHPLLAVRGVPGTHDVALGMAVIDSLLHAGIETLTPIPGFDKAADDRRPRSEWTAFRGPAEIVMLEGWCVGARPQAPSALAAPVNALEANEDADGRWRRYVNDQLAGAYAALFQRLDRRVLLQVPDLDCVYRWRALQEQQLAATVEPNLRHRLMDSAALRRFVMHYERLTLAMLANMPGHADLTLVLDDQHRFTHLSRHY